MPPKPQSCATCRLWDVPLQKDGRRNLRTGRGYRCKAEAPERPALASSFRLTWPPHQGYMHPENGADCPTWVKWEKSDV